VLLSRSGFGRLVWGMSSALVGSGYGWDGCCGCLGGGVFGCVVGWVWRVCVWRAMSDSGE
jgi:hypothetical protein